MPGPRGPSPDTDRRAFESYPLPRKPWNERRNEDQAVEEIYPSSSTPRYHDDRDSGMSRRRSRSPGAGGSANERGGRSPLTPRAMARQRRKSGSNDSSRPEPGEIGHSPSYNYPTRSGSPSKSARRYSGSDHPVSARSGGRGYGYGRGSGNGSVSSRNSSPDKDGRRGETSLRFVRMMKYCLLAETKKQSLQAHFDRLASFPISSDSPALVDARRKVRDAEDDARDCLNDLDDAWDRANRGGRELRGTGSGDRDLRDLVQRVRELERGGRGKAREIMSQREENQPGIPTKDSTLVDQGQDAPTNMDIDTNSSNPQSTTIPLASPSKRQRKLVSLRDKLDDYLARVQDLEEANDGFEDRFNELENWVHLRDGEDMERRPEIVRTWEDLEERRDPGARLRGLSREEENGAASGSGSIDRTVGEAELERSEVAEIEETAPPSRLPDTKTSTSFGTDPALAQRLIAQTDLIQSLEAQVKFLSKAVEALRSERAAKEEEDKKAMAGYMKQECEVQVKKAIEQAISAMKKSKPPPAPSTSSNGLQSSKSASPAIQSVPLQPIPEASVPPRPASSSGYQSVRSNENINRTLPRHTSPSTVPAQMPQLSRSSPDLHAAQLSAAEANATNILHIIRATLEAYRRQGHSLQQAVNLLIPPYILALENMSASARESLFAMVEANVRAGLGTGAQRNWGTGQNGMQYQLQGQQGAYGSGSNGQSWGVQNGRGQYQPQT